MHAPRNGIIRTLGWETLPAIEGSVSISRGVWLEIASADAKTPSPFLRDVRWSIEAESTRPTQHDVVALKGATRG